jgi:spore germination protein YaaH
MIRCIAVVMIAALAGLISLAGCANAQPTASTYALRMVTGYLVPTDARGITAIGGDILTEISPVWYQPDASGQIVFASREAEQSSSNIEAQALSRHVAIVPSIANFRGARWDAALIHEILTTPQTRAAHIAAIVNLVRAHPWAGIDIDYESLDAGDRATYSAFAHDLAAALHQAQKRLALTVHAKTAEPGDWNGAQAQDWKALGASADEIRVMAYDYATADTPPGPIAPIGWVESVLRLAVSEVPREKVMLGMAAYGYDWAKGMQGQDVQWADAQAIARAHAARVTWDAQSQSPRFSYTDSSGRTHSVWFENAHSLQAKLDLAVRDRVGGVFIWRLGGEDPAIWEELRQASGGR